MQVATLARIYSTLLDAVGMRNASIIACLASTQKHYLGRSFFLPVEKVDL